MPKRQPNYRLAQLHVSYTVEEAARRLGVHRNTVREWLRRGLQPLDSTRPMLILGRVLHEFLKQRRSARRKPCGPGQMFCLRCQQPRLPAQGLVELKALTTTRGSLVAICPVCVGLMNRLVNLERPPLHFGDLDVPKPSALSHIDDMDNPSVNSAFRKEGD